MLNLLLFALTLLGLSNAFYLPGVAPTDYKEGQSIPLLVNHLTPALHHASSVKGTTSTYVYSYDYYYPKFHFCKPEGGQ